MYLIEAGLPIIPAAQPQFILANNIFAYRLQI